MCEHCGYDNTQPLPQDKPTILYNCIRCGHRLRYPVNVPGKTSECSNDKPIERRTLLD